MKRKNFHKFNGFVTGIKENKKENFESRRIKNRLRETCNSFNMSGNSLLYGLYNRKECFKYLPI